MPLASRIPSLTRWMTVGLALLAPLEAQVRARMVPGWESSRPLSEAVEFEISGLLSPAILRVTGRRDGDETAELWVRLGEDLPFSANGHRSEERAFCTSIPVWEPPDQGRLTVRLEPRGAGLVVGPLQIDVAVRMDVELRERERDELRGAPVEGVVEIAALQGRSPPDWGIRAREGLVGRFLLCPSGRGRLLLPRSCLVTLVARATPFREPLRRRLRTSRSRSSMRAKLVLSPGRLRAGSRIVDRCAPPSGVPWATWEDALGHSRALEGLDRCPAEEVIERPTAFLRRLRRRARPPVLVGLPDGLAALEHPFTPRTVRSPCGGSLFSNGPVLTVRERGAWVDVGLRLPGHCPPGVLTVHGPEGQLHEGPLADGGRVSLPRPPRGRLVAHWRAERFRGASPLAPPPVAWLALLLL